MRGGVLLAVLWAAGTVYGEVGIRSQNQKPTYVPGQILVKYKNHEWANERLTSEGLTVLKSFTTGALLVKVPAEGFQAEKVEDVVERLRQDPHVLYAEPDYYYYLDDQAPSLPNDEHFSKLYGLHNTGAELGLEDADIDAPEAWQIATGSRDIVVGVIDSGVDYNHPDLAANMWLNPGETGLDAEGRDKATNGVDDDGNGFVDDARGWDFVNNDNDPMDDNSHGTHCAGTIGALGNNGIGVAGVNWETSIFPIKVFNAAGSSSTSAIIEAIEYATQMKVHLTSNSWGGGGFSEALQEAIAAQEREGILFVAAAGNSGGDNDRSPHYPSSYALDNIIAVAASDRRDELAGFSCYGADSVDIAAPGADIYSTTPDGKYGKKSGTSMATPHVAGAAALVWSVYPNASYKDIKNRLMLAADRSPKITGKLRSGRLNVADALEEDHVPPSAVKNLSVKEAGIDSVTLTWSPAGDDGEDGMASDYQVRTSDTPVTSEEEWANAQPVSAAFTSGEAQEIEVVLRNLGLNARGYVTVRAVDNVGQIGELSTSVAFATQEVRLTYEFVADTLENGTFEEPWGLEEWQGMSLLSDSPGGNYGQSANTSAVLGPIDLTDNPALIELEHMHDLERTYDFGHVEISYDDQKTWLPVTKFTGKQEFDRMHIALPDAEISGPVFVKLRLKTDQSVAMDGWKIRAVRLWNTL